MFLDQLKSSIRIQLLSSFILIISLAVLGYIFAIIAMTRIQALQKQINTQTLPILYQVENLSKDVTNFALIIEEIINQAENSDRKTLEKRFTDSKAIIENDLGVLENNIALYSENKAEIINSSRLLFEHADSIAFSYLVEQQKLINAKREYLKKIDVNKKAFAVELKIFELNNNKNFTDSDLLQIANIKSTISEMLNQLEQLEQNLSSSSIINLKNQYTIILRELPEIIFALRNKDNTKIGSNIASFLLEQINTESGLFYIANQLAREQQLVNESITAYRENQINLNEEIILLLDRMRESSTARAESVNSSISFNIILFFTLAALGLFVSFLIIYLFIDPKIIDRIVKLANSMDQVQAGNYHLKIYSQGNDEIAIMAKSLDRFRVAMAEKQGLHEAMENTVEGISRIDTQGRYEYVNEAYAKICGYTVEELIGEDWKITVALEDQEMMQAAYQTMLTEGKVVAKPHGIRKDGSEFNKRVTMIGKYKNNEMVGHHCFMSDITSAKIAEEKIQEAYRFQDLIKKNIPDLLFIKDEKFRIVEANDEFMKLYPSEMQDKIIGFTTLEAYDKDEADEFLYYDKLTLEKGKSETEESIQFPDGKTRVLLTKKVRFENAKGEKFILGLARDISVLKQAENELLESNIELQRFAYVASHDLQEPIRMVSNFTTLLKKKYAEQLDDTAKQYIDFAVNGAERMQQLISDLLEYSRIGNQITSYQEVNVNELLGQIEENLMQEISKTSAQINSDNLPVLYINPMLIMRVMQNIISNALKYKESKVNPVINIKYQLEDEMHKFSISDNGIGMKTEYKDKIFEIFQRLHSKDEYSGTGIGLAMCRKIIEGFGGKIWVDTELGKGSTFYFTLPKKQIN